MSLEHEWSIDFILIEVPSGFQKLKVKLTPTQKINLGVLTALGLYKEIET